MKAFRTMVVALVFGASFAGVVAAQTSPDPAVQAAKEETAVVFDLGRVFGYIRTMEEEDATLRLSVEQVRELYAIMTAVRQTDRIEPDQADEWLVRIEDEILTPKQLVYVDRLYLARETTRGSGTGTGQGNGGGTGESGSIATYIGGGKFNPIIDTSKNMGQDFAAYYAELGGRR